MDNFLHRVNHAIITSILAATSDQDCYQVLSVWLSRVARIRRELNQSENFHIDNQHWVNLHLDLCCLTPAMGVRAGILSMPETQYGRSCVERGNLMLRAINE